MYLRTKENQTKHDNGVIYYANVLVKNNFKVYADLPELAKPPVVNGFIPDVYAISSLEEVIVEVETPDSVSSDHSKSQNLAFVLWAKAAAKRKYHQKIV